VEPDRAKIEKYFTSKFPKWAIWLIVIGVLALLGPVAVKVVGLLMVVGGGFAIYNSTQVASDAEIDEWKQEDLSKLKQRSLVKMGIDASALEGETAIITGLRLRNIGKSKFGYRKGKDGNLRFTPVNSQLISFTRDQLLIYNCSLDLITGKPENEETEEYFYKDVVSAQTKSESFTVNIPGSELNGIQLTDAETFSLTTSGGNGPKVELRANSLIEKLGGGEIPTTTAERTIQGIRTMLRDKKR
jgi:hypothetical protein